MSLEGNLSFALDVVPVSKGMSVCVFFFFHFLQLHRIILYCFMNYI